ncbi:MAG: signal peptidase II [Psychrilyobacter sp.]|nr:signal peptidase II [Psychrilyobacter sp.]
MDIRYFFSLLVVIMFFALDFFTKKWAEKNKDNNNKIFNSKIQILFTKNYGIAFNKLSNRKNLIYTMNFFLFIYLGYILSTDLDNFLWYSLIISGGLGNLVSRLQKGYVIDFIYFNIKKWPVFNIADFEIFLGIGVILVKELLNK